MEERGERASMGMIYRSVVVILERKRGKVLVGIICHRKVASPRCWSARKVEVWVKWLAVDE